MAGGWGDATFGYVEHKDRPKKNEVQGGWSNRDQIITTLNSKDLVCTVWNMMRSGGDESQEMRKKCDWKSVGGK